MRVTGGPRSETMDVQNSWGMPKRCIQQKAARVDLREAYGAQAHDHSLTERMLYQLS